jgi:hypothetical protein
MKLSAGFSVRQTRALIDAACAGIAGITFAASIAWEVVL